MSDPWTEARAAWPTLHVERHAFEAFAHARIAPETPSSDPIWADLYLACACSQRDRAALQIFETQFLSEVDRLGRKGNVSPVLLDEVRQELREKLFVGRAGAHPKILDYSGTGSLRKWIRMVVVRVWLNAAIRGPRETPHEDRILDGLLGSGGDTELEYMKRLYMFEFKKSFYDAFNSLQARDKNLIRYTFVDGLILDEIGIVYGISRSSAARWLQKAHNRLTLAIRSQLIERLNIDRAEYDRILSLILSQIEVTMERLVGP